MTTDQYGTRKSNAHTYTVSSLGKRIADTIPVYVWALLFLVPYWSVVIAWFYHSLILGLVASFISVVLWDRLLCWGLTLSLRKVIQQNRLESTSEAQQNSSKETN